MNPPFLINILFYSCQEASFFTLTAVVALVKYPVGIRFKGVAVNNNKTIECMKSCLNFPNINNLTSNIKNQLFFQEDT